MAKKDEVSKLRRESRRLATKELRTGGGFPIAPRKAMSQAKKASKDLAYPLAPYAAANPFQLFRWAAQEWDKLGRWQGLALPVIIITALRTWEKEKAAQETYFMELERRAIRRENARLYGTYGVAPKKRKLFGFIPSPGGKS
jgi:hypothetical protein